MTTVKKILIGFTAGVVIGMLYAPAKGSKTRKKLADIGSDIKDGWNEIADRVSNQVDHAKAGIDRVASSTLEKIEIRDFEVDDRAGYL